MAFTMENTLRSIVTDRLIGEYFAVIFPRALLSMVPEQMMDCSIAYLQEHVTTPWGAPFMGYALIRTANLCMELVTRDVLKFIPLWHDGEDWIPQTECNTKESVFLSTISANTPGNKPGVIICPGGAYSLVSLANEGYEVAQRMEAAGYKAFILNYRTDPNRYPAPQLDLALAVKHVRLHAEEYGVEPDHLLLMGSSAGGHLCASFASLHAELEETLTWELATHHPELAKRYLSIHSIRPDALGLCYPVISFLSETHDPSFQSLSGGDENLREKLSVEKHVDSTYPKTFVWACRDDDVVPISNTLRLRDALEAVGVPVCMRLYPTGGHGCGCADGTSAEGWIDEMLTFLK